MSNELFLVLFAIFLVLFPIFFSNLVESSHSMFDEKKEKEEKE